MGFVDTHHSLVAIKPASMYGLQLATPLILIERHSGNAWQIELFNDTSLCNDKNRETIRINI